MQVNQDDLVIVDKLLPYWQRKAQSLCKTNPHHLVAESMLSSAVAGWIVAIGKREVARRLYLLALQITADADKDDAAAQKADASTKH
jgi:hypothetical protein